MPQTHAPAKNILRRIADNWPELSTRVRPSIIYLYRARDLLLEDAEAALKPHGLRVSDLDVLGALRTQPRPRQLTPTALYQQLLLSSGGLTKILHRLEAAGLIDRPANPEDGRSKLVRLTRQGERLLDKAIDPVLENEARRMSALSKTEQKELGRLLGKLLDNWEPD